MRFTVLFIIAGFVFAHTAAAQDLTATQQKVKTALQLEYRTTADRDRDSNRLAPEAIEFMGLKDDMRVFEFAPGNGWYTKILAPVLKDKGHLSIGYPAKWLVYLEELMAAPQMEKVHQVDLAMDWDEEKLVYVFEGMDFQTSKLDMFLNIREYHNLHGEERAEFDQTVFNALKPGGRYVVIDHTRRHMEPDNPENWRREDPIAVLTEVLRAGFELEKSSDMFYRPDDTLAYEVGRKTVTGNTDRFFFVFRKPK